MSIIILGIESSCDETSAAIVEDGFLLSNIIASQEVHKNYGGVIPEFASRAHQQNIIPVVDTAIKESRIIKEQINAIAVTRGPGLMGSLLVGVSFAKGFSLAQNIPIIEINHLHAHVLSLFLLSKNETKSVPTFPFICLLVSGGHTQLIIIEDYLKFKVIGQTIDDAAGETFDKCAKIMNLPYPGGPIIDKLAKEGDQNAFKFSKPKIEGYNYSFSGLKTSFLYFLRDKLKEDSQFIEKNKNDLCASIQKTIIDILVEKLILAVKDTGIKNIAIAGGVAANSGLRSRIIEISSSLKLNYFLPEIRYTTDNAAMIALAGYYKYLNKEFSNQSITPLARL